MLYETMKLGAKIGQRTFWLLAITGLALATALANGLAAPPQLGQRHDLPIPSHVPALAAYQPRALSPWYMLPVRPYVIVLEAEVMADNTIGWGFDLDQQVQVWLWSDGYYQVPPLVPDTTPLIHIRAQHNQLYWLVEASGHIVLRINGEIAWEGQLPDGIKRVRLFGMGGLRDTSADTLWFKQFSISGTW